MRLLIVLLVSGAAVAQPPRRIEVYGNIGRAHLAEDEGSLGGATAAGAIMVAPITARFAIEADLQTASASREFLHEDRTTSRQSFLNGALVRRWGTGRIYGLMGGGAGVQWERTTSVGRVYTGNPPVETGRTEVTTHDTGATLHGKVGLVVAPVSGLVLRTDFIVSFRFVSPTFGARIGAGWRF